MSRLLGLAGVVTLAVTLFRLFAELNGWSALWASSEGGGPGALIGIVWLIFVFGAVFGARLARQGRAPERPGRAAGIVAAISVGAVALGVVSLGALGGPEQAFPQVLPINFAIYVVAAVLVARVWPALARVNAIYGVIARVPVVVLTVIAVSQNWGTHYEKLGGGDGVVMEPVARTAWLCAAQLFVWIPFTINFGGLAGCVAAWWVSRRR